MKFSQLFKLLLEANPENRIKFLYDKYADKFKKLIDIASDFGYNTEDAFFRFIVMHIDPTHGEYSEWLVRQFVKMTIPQLDRALFEDYTTIHDDLQTYHQFKKLLKNTPEFSTWGDINQVPNIQELRRALHVLDDSIDSEREKIALKLAAKDVKKIYNSDKWLVLIPQTEQASCAYGARTRWCTAAERHNRFDYYNQKGPLYIFIDKNSDEKFQFHFQSHQYMDADDSEIDVKEFVEANEELREFIINIAKENGNTFYPCILNPTECMESSFKRMEELGMMERTESEIKIRHFGSWGALTGSFFDGEDEHFADRITSGDFSNDSYGEISDNIDPTDYYDWLDEESKSLVQKYFAHNFGYNEDDNEDIETLMEEYPDAKETIYDAIRWGYRLASEEAAFSSAEENFEKAILQNMNAKRNIEYKDDGFVFTMNNGFTRLFKIMLERHGHIDNLFNIPSSLSVNEILLQRSRKAWSSVFWSTYGEICQEEDGFISIKDPDYEPDEKENGKTFNVYFQESLANEVGPPWEHREYLRLKKAGQLDLGLEQFNRYYNTK